MTLRMNCTVKVLKEVASDPQPRTWQLWFQWCEYRYSDKNRPDQKGFRFIWKRPDGTIQDARGQARLPSIAMATELMELARAEGWGDLIGDSQQREPRKAPPQKVLVD